ncbi:MAG: hypothetical protein V5A39_06305 [Haloarculaceae archaeon]
MIGRDNRAVSVAITHSLTLAITAILISTLLVGAGQFLTDQEELAARQQLGEVGSDVVSHINTLDRLNATGEDVNVTVRPSYPEQVVGEPYTINITDDKSSFPFETDYALEIRSESLNQPIQYPLSTDVTLDETAQAKGGQVTVCLVEGNASIGGGCP